jgi:hypothetical protein
MESEKRLIDANPIVKFIMDGLNNPDKLKALGYDAIEILAEIEFADTVDAVEAAEMREFARDVAYQFGYYCQNGGRLHLTHGGLSTLEWAFCILGWENPHPVPECECEIDGCHEHATCGTPTEDGYKFVCGMHFRERKDNG